ncbi:hypothetical protein GCM10028790_19240 [Micromonospora taraxaci]
MPRRSRSGDPVSRELSPSGSGPKRPNARTLRGRELIGCQAAVCTRRSCIMLPVRAERLSFFEPDKAFGGW